MTEARQCSLNRPHEPHDYILSTLEILTLVIGEYHCPGFTKAEAGAPPTEVINKMLEKETDVSEDRRKDLLMSMRKVHAFYDLLHTERLRDSYVIEDPERREEAKKDVRFIDKLCRRLEADIVKEEMNVKSHARETATLKYVKKDELHN